MASFSPDPVSAGEKPDRRKPRIWAEGRQRPPFDLRALLRVSTANSRALVAPALVTLARHLDRFGTRVEDGHVRIPAKRLGHTGKWLPGHVATGRRLRDTAAMTRVAAFAARGKGPVEAMPFRDWNDAPPSAAPSPAPVAMAAPAPVVAERTPPQRPKRPQPLPAAPVSASEDRDTLEAIRALMHTPAVEPVHPQRAPKAPPPPPGGAGALPELAPAEPAPRSALFRLTGRGLGLASVVLAFPLGLAQAGYAYARGEDLRLAP